MITRGNLYCPGDLFTNRFDRCGLLFKATAYPANVRDWKGLAKIDGVQYVFTSKKVYQLDEAGREDGQGSPISELISC
ncbi:hypothetical protein AB6A40_010076 [Gnathostoma spinigerum]|uniref:Uncharacterized protein n=1 Tax=Gnathostoma spinigerum TaxID=75299 RepID=A0ABD6EW79_9BILA